jgi:hypothetical protein
LRDFYPSAVELTAQEAELLKQVSFELDFRRSDADLGKSCEAAYQLATLVLARRAIPAVRIEYFTDPERNTGRSRKSHEQVFESNGTSEDDILRHPHFLPHLRYFLFGPDLPEPVMSAFCPKVSALSPVTSSEVESLWSLARSLTRSTDLNRSTRRRSFSN